MKPHADVEPFILFNAKEMVLSHWKRVQGLAEECWHKWKNRYLHSPQTRQKWTNEYKDYRYIFLPIAFKQGDIELMKDQYSDKNG